MYILNVLLKQTTTIKAQDTAFSYAEMLKMKMNFIIKTMFKQIEHKIIILQYKYSFLDEEKIKSAKIVKIINTKIRNNDKKNNSSKKTFQQKYYAHAEFS